MPTIKCYYQFLQPKLTHFVKISVLRKNLRFFSPVSELAEYTYSTGLKKQGIIGILISKLGAFCP